MSVKARLAIIGVFIGCCSNVIFLEILVKADPGSGNLITFSQFAFIALKGFIFTSKFFTKKPKIGLKDYSTLVVLCFVASVCNNYAFGFHIPMPLHMTFRAGSLMANMVMGILILKKRYELCKYVSIFMITTGIILCTIASGSVVRDNSNKNLKSAEDVEQYPVFFWWSIGISLLTAALFLSALMGIYQELLYKRCGKHPFEALFYTHLLPIPGFLFMYQNLWEHTGIAFASQAMDLPWLSVLGLNMKIPSTVFYLLCNCAKQYVCITSVYVLTTECSSLTVTLVVTLRKFVSLVFSILYFKNDFTFFHWIGTTLVFIGTIIFTEVVPQMLGSLRFLRCWPAQLSDLGVVAGN